MRKLLFTASAISILISQTGCFGSFNLVKNIHAFNEEVSENRIINTLVMYLLFIVPVYPVSAFLDVVLFNLIEFWSGTNPIAMEAGQMEEQLITYKGNTYKIIATKNQMAFEKLQNGESIKMGSLIFKQEDNSWNFEKDGQLEKIVSINLQNNTVDYYTEEGIKTIDSDVVENYTKENLSNSKLNAFAFN